MGSKGSPERSGLSKASLVEGFNLPSAIAVTIAGGISLVELRLVRENLVMVKRKAYGQYPLLRARAKI